MRRLLMSPELLVASVMLCGCGGWLTLPVLPAPELGFRRSAEGLGCARELAAPAALCAAGGSTGSCLPLCHKHGIFGIWAFLQRAWLLQQH